MGSVKLGDYNLEQCGYDPFVGYASSKTANIWMANELERRYGSQGLHSISVHPGGIETGLQASHAEEPAKLIAASMCLTRPFEQLVTLAKIYPSIPVIQQPHIKQSFKSIEQGAASVVLAAIGKEYEGVGGVSPRNLALRMHGFTSR